MVVGCGCEVVGCGWVEGVLWCGMGWKEEEVIGQRVQEKKWLSAKPANKTE